MNDMAAAPIVARAVPRDDPDTRFRSARAAALLLPAALLAGAWGSQLIGGLKPCEMCLWQRWPHYAALTLAALAFALPGRTSRTVAVVLAGVAIAASGVIGILQAGAEWHWWHDVSACTSSVGKGLSADEMLRAIMAAPVVRCDAAQWRLAGVSLAGWNALVSLGGAAAIGWLLARRTAR